MRRSWIDGESTSTSCLMGRVRGPTLELDDSFDDTNRHFVRRIQEVEIGEALKRMKGGKAMGPDGIPIEVWRCLGDRAIVCLTNLFNLIFSVKQDA